MNQEATCITCKRERDGSPFTFKETQDYVYSVVMEGIHREEKLIDIVDRILCEGLAIDDYEIIMGYLRQQDAERIEYYKSPSRKSGFCSKCHTVSDIDKLMCGECNDETLRWSDGIPIFDNTVPRWIKKLVAKYE